MLKSSLCIHEWYKENDSRSTLVTSHDRWNVDSDTIPNWCSAATPHIARRKQTETLVESDRQILCLVNVSRRLLPHTLSMGKATLSLLMDICFCLRPSASAWCNLKCNHRRDLPCRRTEVPVNGESLGKIRSRYKCFQVHPVTCWFLSFLFYFKILIRLICN